MPSTGGLFQTIERFDQATEMLRAIRINKTRRLAHENLFLQNTMKENILNIQLTKIPTSSNS
jgi:hypothetical protein